MLPCLKQPISFLQRCISIWNSGAFKVKEIVWHAVTSRDIIYGFLYVGLFVSDKKQGTYDSNDSTSNKKTCCGSVVFMITSIIINHCVAFTLQMLDLW